MSCCFKMNWYQSTPASLSFEDIALACRVIYIPSHATVLSHLFLGLASGHLMPVSGHLVALPVDHPLTHVALKQCQRDLRYSSPSGCVFYLVHRCAVCLVETDTQGHPFARPWLIVEKPILQASTKPTCAEKAVRQLSRRWIHIVVLAAEAAAAASSAAATTATTT